MKNLVFSMIFLAVVGCSASIGTTPTTTRTTYTAPAVSSTTYSEAPVATSTTVTRTTY